MPSDTLRKSPAAPSLERRTPELSARLVAALLAGKSAAAASRLLGRGGGTSLPGMVARRVDPAVLDRLVGRCGVPVVAITGSNGKTTSARLCTALLRGEGVTVEQNSAGANLIQGVTTLAVGSADLRGRIDQGVLIAEVDEGALTVVASELRPRILLVTDIFRDQLDRYGEMNAVAGAIDRVASALPDDATLVLNGDDPLVAIMATERRGPRVTFGLELPESRDRITRAADTIRCPRCSANLEYARIYLSHMGDYRCTNCGFARPALDVAVTALQVDGVSETRMTLRTPAGALTLRIPQAGVHVAYNAAAAVAICHALGIAVPHAAASVAGVRPAFGRLESIAAGGKRIILAFSKNPTSFNTTLRTLAGAGEPRHLLVAFSNTLIDGEDFGWLWDVDLESAAGGIEHATAAGRRADEVANRLKYAGVPPSRITVIEDRRAALDSALAAVPPGGTLAITAGYTPTIEMREAMRRRGWVGRYWQA
ncbi:MAG TPA: MurT ligase domain-containing protein [Candidatus Dormibacteraeota bacterium]